MQAGAGSVAAWRGGRPVTAGRLLADVRSAAREIPEGGYLLNLCADRYAFAVALLAAITRRCTTLLPPAATPAILETMRAFAPGARFMSDAEADAPGLARVPLVLTSPEDPEVAEVPMIEGEQVAAIVFTSGTTGSPRPHVKRWARLVASVLAEARRLQIGGPGHVVLGTVPPQHMYGLESTVLLPLLAGAALTAERLYFPVQIDEAIGRLPPRRVLFTTPFHLRNWLEGGSVARPETIVSATAALPASLASEVEARTGAELFEIYGCTETGQLATRRPTRSTTWRLLDGLRLHERDGRTWASGGHVEEPTALSDAIARDANDPACFALGGRDADMVNIAGKRSSLAYLNHQLAAIPGVVDGVYLFPESEGQEVVTRLAAFVVAPGVEPGTILAALRDRIDPVFLPRPLVMVDALPRRETGKIPVDELRRLAGRAGPGHPGGNG